MAWDLAKPSSARVRTTRPTSLTAGSSSRSSAVEPARLRAGQPSPTPAKPSLRASDNRKREKRIQDEYSGSKSHLAKPRQPRHRLSQCSRCCPIEGLRMCARTKRKSGGEQHVRTSKDHRRRAFGRVCLCRSCRSRDDLDLLRRRRPRAQALPGGCRRLGQADRQRGQGDLDAELGDRAPGPLPAAARRQVARHRRVPDRRDLAGHPRQPLRRPHRQDPGRGGRPALQGDRREQHGRRQAGGHALVHRRRHAATTARTCSRSCRQAAARDLAGARPPPPRSSRTRRAPAATTGCGASSTRARPTRA